MTRLVMAGHSHIFAMGVPGAYRGDPRLTELTCADISYITRLEAWIGRRTAEYWDGVVEAARGKTALLLWNGNQHHAEFLLAPDPMFDVVVAEDDTVEGHVVPKGLVKQLFRPGFGDIATVIERLKGVGARVVLLGTPAPKADAAFFEKMLRSSDYLKDMAKQRGFDLEKARVTPGRLRFKLWRIVQEMTQEYAQAGAVEFIPVPQASLDADGLKRQYWENDITHANRAYGELMMRHVMERL
jgi:hypothetical protein